MRFSSVLCILCILTVITALYSGRHNRVMMIEVCVIFWLSDQSECINYRLVFTPYDCATLSCYSVDYCVQELYERYSCVHTQVKSGVDTLLKYDI